MPKQLIKSILINDLNLWTENPRDPMNSNFTDFEIISKAITDNEKKWNLDKLINEMGDFYDLSELPIVVDINGKMIVFDGNRRIAVLKYLQNQDLYSNLGGGLFFNEEPKDLKELIEIPCNVCDKETALLNIERKHVNNGTWGALERDYFLMNHRQERESLFLKIENQTGIISQNEKMNRRFIKEEIFTESNLNDIGFGLEKDLFVSIYNESIELEVFERIVELVNQKKISTRGDKRGKLKESLFEYFPEFSKQIKPFDFKLPLHKVSMKQNKGETIKKNLRKTPITKNNDKLFGGSLELIQGNVNNLYRAIDSIYSKDNENKSILMIIGMSLRLLIEVVAREQMPDKENQDNIYKEFLKKAFREMGHKQKTINFYSLTTDWLNKRSTFEGLIGKFAHGNIITSKNDILNCSYIVGDIINFYYKKRRNNYD